jgi:hypothetical protein
VLCAKRNCGLIRKKDGGQQQRRWRRKGIGRRLNECERSAEMDDNVGWENVKMRRKNRNGYIKCARLKGKNGAMRGDENEKGRHIPLPLQRAKTACCILLDAS